MLPSMSDINYLQSLRDLYKIDEDNRHTIYLKAEMSRQLERQYYMGVADLVRTEYALGWIVYNLSLTEWFMCPAEVRESNQKYSLALTKLRALINRILKGEITVQ